MLGLSTFLFPSSVHLIRRSLGDCCPEPPSSLSTPSWRRPLVSYRQRCTFSTQDAPSSWCLADHAKLTGHVSTLLNSSRGHIAHDLHALLVNTLDVLFLHSRSKQKRLSWPNIIRDGRALDSDASATFTCNLRSIMQRHGKPAQSMSDCLLEFQSSHTRGGWESNDDQVTLLEAIISLWSYSLMVKPRAFDRYMENLPSYWRVIGAFSHQSWEDHVRWQSSGEQLLPLEDVSQQIKHILVNELMFGFPLLAMQHQRYGSRYKAMGQFLNTLRFVVLLAYIATRGNRRSFDGVDLLTTVEVYRCERLEEILPVLHELP